MADCEGKDNIFVCGAFSLPGIPLLEGAARSGLMVAEFIGAERPWKEVSHRAIGKDLTLFGLIVNAVLLWMAILVSKLAK